MHLTINTELRDLIPALTEQEARDLRNSVESRGVETPLLVAELRGETVLVDGFARHKIATELNVPFETREFTFSATPESIRERLERDAKRAKANARSNRMAKKLKVVEETLEPDELAAVEAALPEALEAAKERELKLYRLNHVMNRRSIERFDLIRAAWRRNRELYRDASYAAKVASARVARAVKDGEEVSFSSNDENQAPSRGTVSRLAKDTGINETACERALLVIKTAEGDFPRGYESFQDDAIQLIAEIRDKSSDVTIAGAYKRLMDLKKARDAADEAAKAVEGEGSSEPTPEPKVSTETSLPEDEAIKVHLRLRETVFSHDARAVAARFRNERPSELEIERKNTEREIAWLRAYAAALTESRVEA